MTPILTAEEMRAADRRAIGEIGIPGPVLMENAARGATDMLSRMLGGLRGKRIAILCGRGNNGGDGIAMARHAINAGALADVILIHPPEELSPDAALQHRILAAFAPDSITVWSGPPGEGRACYDAVVDAMLGTGTAGSLREPYGDAVAWSASVNAAKLAVDIPTGIDSDTGAAEGRFFMATATATMAALKPGLLLGRGAGAAGDVRVIDIGTPVSLYADAGIALIDAECAAAGIGEMKQGGNKYDRGKVLVIAGSGGMTGAAVMASEAALHAGAGLTLLALPARALPIPQSIAPEIMTLSLPSDEAGAFAADAFDGIIGKSESYGAIAVGPGLSRSPEAARAVRGLVAGGRSAWIVLDADGLNAFAGDADALRDHESALVITPHHGEMARLLGLKSEEIDSDPVGHARDAARRINGIVVLKGAPTVVAEPGGKAFINSAGNPGMGTGGTGDVLTGTIAALLARGDSAGGTAGVLAAVYLHSLAGDLAAAAKSVHAITATDIIHFLPHAFRAVTSR
ncbi:MAG: Bifunctional NAD(P)H-hydrate repair enzyme [Chlorobi bacterium]|nr:Bifunctional NAD(P)H-hydrate repair enzyme [Chlorobiota bacterium]